MKRTLKEPTSEEGSSEGESESESEGKSVKSASSSFSSSSFFWRTLGELESEASLLFTFFEPAGVQNELRTFNSGKITRLSPHLIVRRQFTPLDRGCGRLQCPRNNRGCRSKRRLSAAECYFRIPARRPFFPPGVWTKLKTGN